MSMCKVAIIINNHYYYLLADPAAEMKDKSNALHYAVSEEMLKEIFASTKENMYVYR